ncbi:glycoside hydrolase family 3 C-terminal domain-containing protein [Aquihabitans sp. G128]|uniref:beta-glucosidase family protein n=1 Tax=Aquihabitans sp. G128 TaxID=2849779 RepID=UPI001C22C3BD|nr:glycoside hydrolase family 3 protein [Aquihabitans sp. G128]QXC59985.1 glycoside hydrolase family 3 C-terminal domain-containing protein [Aquihabitans sp. G128]
MSASAFAAAATRVAEGADPHVEAAALVGLMTVEERHWCLDGDVPFWAGIGDLGEGGYHRRTFPAARVDRLGIPGFAFSDGPRGVVIGPATAFPVSMARGATWDLDLEERIGEAIGRELRAVGASLYGGVCVNLLRHPAWGRAQETYGEDPHHVGELGAALTRGVQRHAMACAKHFAANSMENARFTVDVRVDEVALHEVYLPHFRRIVEEGVAAVMTAYNAVGGEWCGESPTLIAEVLRGEWGFDGFVISDWIFGLRDAGTSVAAGLDVEMPYRMIRAHGLDAALAAGTCTDAQVDAAVERTLATLLRFAEVLAGPAPGIEVLACAEHRALAREAATKAVVLLSNERVDGVPVLPVDLEVAARIAVVGPLAGARNLGDGGSSDVWAPEVVTPLDGFRAALDGTGAVLVDDPADADVAVVVVGYTKADEGEFIGGSGTTHLADLMPGADDPELAAAFAEVLAADTDPWANPNPGAGDQLGFAKGGDRTSLRLRDEDVARIRSVAATCPRTVVAIVAGSAVLVDEWVDDVAGVVQCWYSGMEGGHALAAVVLGRAEPTGRLPFTVPSAEAHLPPFDAEATEATYDRWHGYWRLARDGHAAAFPFGFGLSYTDLSIGTAGVAAVDGDLVVSGTVRNAGARPGVEVVQVYVGPAAGEPPRLAGFARLDVAAGEERPFEVVVPVARLARRDPAAHAWVPAAGTHEVVVARHAEDPAAHRLTVDLG